MYEFQGWATVRETARNSNETDDQAALARALNEIAPAVEQLGAITNVEAGLSVMNGSHRLWLIGARNHAGVLERCREPFSAIARAAPGSYGVLSWQDHDANEAAMVVMRRGVVERIEHPLLSPPVPMIEDTFEA